MVCSFKCALEFEENGALERGRSEFLHVLWLSPLVLGIGFGALSVLPGCSASVNIPSLPLLPIPLLKEKLGIEPKALMCQACAPQLSFSSCTFYT